jgi:hypothetical protein
VIATGYRKAVVAPQAGTLRRYHVAMRILSNRRDLSPAKALKPQEIAYYPAAAMPAPDAKAPVMVDRKAALAERLESPASARARTGR